MARSHHLLPHAPHLGSPRSPSPLWSRRDRRKSFTPIGIRTLSVTHGVYPPPRSSTQRLPNLSTASRPVARHSPLATISPRINTYKTASKQTTLITFRMNSYTKPQGEAQSLLTTMSGSKSWRSPRSFHSRVKPAIPAALPWTWLIASLRVAQGGKTGGLYEP
jgi:hypothetical protein